MSFPWVSSRYGEAAALRGIFIVPVIRQRLASAVLVQQAFHEMDRARSFHPSRDVVAVTLPKSLSARPSATTFWAGDHRDMPIGAQPRDLLADALERLPDQTLLLASLASDDSREVFPVTPCDGVVEALRCARERNTSLEFIDADIAPGHLGLRGCVAEPDWPDDELALIAGADWYLQRITPWLKQPPTRFEPIDSYREDIMAERVRELHTWFERVLLVCDATHVDPILRRLRSPSRVGEHFTAPIRIDYNSAKPSPGTRLYYLDDIPRLVEAYELARRNGVGHSFRKLAAVLAEIENLRIASHDKHLAVRHQLAFATFLTRRLALDGRISPRLDDALRAARACFGAVFANRTRRHLLGYFEFHDVDRIKEDETGEGEAAIGPEIETNSGSSGHTGEQPRIVARGCNPKAHSYGIVLPIRVSATSRYGLVAWPPHKELLTKMHTKALSDELRPKPRRRVVRFRGSIAGGIDLRRTMRSQLEAHPALYVKELQRKRRVKKSVPRQDPVVWLFDPFDAYGEDWDHGSHVIAFGMDLEAGYTTFWDCYSKRRLAATAHPTPFILWDFRVHGAVTFVPTSWTHGDLRKAFGDPIDTDRIPLFRSRDPKLAVLDDRLKLGAPWVEILVQGAIAFAKERIVVVCPDAFKVPASCKAMASAHGIAVHILSLSRFTADERRRLRLIPTIEGRHDIPADVDRNDPELNRQIVARFRDLVESYW